MKAGLIGGATISFGYLIDYLQANREPFTLINTQSFPTGKLRIFNPLIVLFKVLFSLFRSDVIFLNSSRGGTKYLAPYLFYLSRLVNQKFVFRPFGGDIKDYTASYTLQQKKRFEQTILRADIFFLQTQELINHYQKPGVNIIHLPTSRKSAPAHLIPQKKSYQKRFIFLGFINEYKGIDLLLEATRKLGEDYTIHIYGPIKDNAYHDKFSQQPNVYQGVLAKEDVLLTLSNYDVVVLPTYYEGEGYPGVLIEAYSLGLPVLATHWKAIPEIVHHLKTGYLIKPRSTEALIEGVQHFDQENYPVYAQNAQHYFTENFDADRVNQRIIKAIQDL